MKLSDRELAEIIATEYFVNLYTNQCEEHKKTGKIIDYKIEVEYNKITATIIPVKSVEYINVNLLV